MNKSKPGDPAAPTFGVYTTVGVTHSDKGYPSIVLYTSRGESIFGQSAQVYWNLTVDEARVLGVRLIETAACALISDGNPPDELSGEDKPIFHAPELDERARQGKGWTQYPEERSS